MDLKERAGARIDADHDKLIALSHAIHSTPELAYVEDRSAAALVAALEDGGMKTETGTGGLSTAFRARAGSEGPNVFICAEYDALPEIGHACGHNIIGSSSIGAALALSELAEDIGIKVTVIGTPAEEEGGGKCELIDAGAFDDADVAMMVHPGPLEVVDLPTLAVAHLAVEFHGRESHASSYPEKGINALDAANISYTAVAALRQHILPEERVHGIFTHGGDAPNVVPKYTSAHYYVRAKTLEQLEPLMERVQRCFEAGALATGCEMNLSNLSKPYDSVTHNPAMAGFYDANLKFLGRHSLPAVVRGTAAGSTDMGNVSKVCPTIHPMMSIDSLPAVNHQADFTSHCISPAGDRAVLDAAKALAFTAIDLATIDGAIDQAKEEFSQAGEAAGEAVG